MLRKVRRLSLEVVVTVFFLTPFAIAADADNKIDAELMDQLTDSADAETPFFILLKEQADTKFARQIANRFQRAQAVRNTLETTAASTQQALQNFLQARDADFESFWIINTIRVEDGTLDLAREIARRPEVLRIVSDVVFEIPQPTPAADSGTSGIEWGVNKISAPQLWNATRGEGIVVANIDTGVDFDHPALVNQYLGNLGGGNFDHTNSWEDPSSVCGDPSLIPCDNNNHGTHTMGTMVGDDGGTNQIGVAPAAQWIACKGCESNSCSGSALLTCAEWVLQQNPHVVNNSWGGGGGNTWYQQKVQQWRNAGIFPAFSAGNSGSACGTVGSPGDYPDSFGTGATTSSDGIASFSSRGPSAFGEIKPDASAPGVSVRSSVNGGGYSSFSGTSMASPHVAGSVALLWAARADLNGNISLTEQALMETATPLTSSQTCGGVSGSAIPNNTYGHGRIDVWAAFNWNGVPNSAPTVTINSPAPGADFPCDSTVNFGGQATDTEDDDGALTASIQWSENGTQFGTGANASTTFSCSSVGFHTIDARVTDSGGLTDTDTVQIEIFDPNQVAAPSNLEVSMNGDQATCTWQDNSNNEDYFQLERKPFLKGREKKNAKWEVVASEIPADTTTYTTTLPNGKWDLRVAAYNAFDFSDYSNVIRADSSGDSGGQDPSPGQCNSNGVCELGETCSSCDDCEGKTTGKPSGRFCCGNGVLETAEGDGAICDGNF